MSGAALWAGLVVAGWALATGWLVGRCRNRASGRLLAHRVGGPRGPIRRVSSMLGRAMARAGLGWPVRRVVQVWCLLLAAAVAAGWLVPAGVAAVLVGLAAGGPIGALHAGRHRAEHRAVTQLPGALDGVARALRSGAGMGQAVGEVGAVTPPPLGPDLVGAAHHPDGLVAGLEDWAGRRPNAEVHLTAAALCLAAEVGGTASRATEGLAATLRQRAESAADVRTLATQSRLSGLVIGLLPIGFAGLTALSDGAVARFLFASPAGVTCLVIGLGLDGLGAWWMLRLSAPGETP